MAGAVTGIFQADFGSFFDAVEKSEVKLKAMESGAEGVESKLSRMANSFSGQKIIQDATLMAEVFERAGGSAAFTEKELARMGAAGAEAVSKLEAMGKDVPDNLRKMADETKGAAKETDGFTASVKTLALGFLSLQTAKAAFNFVADIAATAGALQDLSDQTQISTTDLQIMGNAMKDFGVDTDTMGRALFKLSKNIANGDDGVADALLTMGLSLEQVKNMRGEELFLTIQNGLAKLDGGLRDTTAVTLYGEKLGMAMAGAAKGTEAAIEEQKKLNNIWSNDTIKALDSATESIEKMKGSLVAMAANAIGPVAEGFNTLVGVFNKGASAWQVNIAMARDMLEGNLGLGSGTEHLTRLIDQLNQEQLKNVPATKASTDAANENAVAKDNQAGATKRAREAEAGLKDFEAQTKAMKDQQDIVDSFVAKRDAAAKKKSEDDAAELQMTARKETGAREYMKAVGEFVTKQNEAAAAEKAYTDEQNKMTAANDAAVAKLNEVGKAHTDAGAAAGAGTKETVAGYQGVAQQVTVTGDAIKEYINLMRYTAAANAILGEGHLFTTQSQRDRLAGIPGFASGVENFSGGLAKVHGGETLVNLAPGTSVIPAGAGGVSVNNVFHLTDTESNLARRVSETIMRTVRAGTQLGTA